MYARTLSLRDSHPVYMATSDGGGGNGPLMNGQNTATLRGKMLRLDVARDDVPADPNRDYGIPPANPFAGGGGAGEVWLYGLRNPFRASFDRDRQSTRLNSSH